MTGKELKKLKAVSDYKKAGGTITKCEPKAADGSTVYRTTRNQSGNLARVVAKTTRPKDGPVGSGIYTRTS